MRFFLIDRILEINKNSHVKGFKNISMTEDFFDEHFPKYPIMPGMLITEGAVELSSWLISFSSDFENIGLLKSLKLVKFKSFAMPGDQIFFESKIIGEHKNSMDFSCVVMCGDKKISNMTFELVKEKADNYIDITELKRQFEIINR